MMLSEAFPRAEARAGRSGTLELRMRRLIFGILVATTTIGLTGWLAVIVAADGFTALDTILVVAFAVKALWVTLVFWNSAVGFALRHVTGNPAAYVLLPIADACSDDPIAARTAIVMTVRDEDPKPAFGRLQVVKASLDATGFGDKFDYFLLSDSTSPEVIAAEDREFAALRARSGAGAHLVYRRRESNVDFKAGNLRDFCNRWGQNYEFMVDLDADSVMTGQMIVHLIRVMQANPGVGILQSLIDCVLPPTALARIFEFGHRHVWHNYVLGSAWWQGERGQYRGHNAAVRVAAYANHSRLSEFDHVRDAGSHVMCYDQIEAALLHRAGYDVRELPAAGGSYEGLPPALPDFLQRYCRWCQGNLKNLRLLGLRGLTPMDRYHFIGVAHRFLGWPAFVLFVLIAAYTTISWSPGARFPMASAALLYVIFFSIYFAPRILGLIDAALTGDHRYGGASSLMIGGAIDILMTLLFVPIAMVGVTGFMIKLLFGFHSTWAPQRRAGYQLHWQHAVRELWPQTAFGLALFSALAVAAPAALLWFLPFLCGLLLAVPFAVLTSSTELALLMERRRLCALSEDVISPIELDKVRHFNAQSSSP